MHTFFVPKFVQSQIVTRKKAFVRKMLAKNVDEIDSWGQFHQQFTRIFFMRRSQKFNKTDGLTVFLNFWNLAACIKADHKTLMKLTPGVEVKMPPRASFM
jgi:hypothetical protein